jgi:dephospho-CoA kinase
MPGTLIGLTGGLASGKSTVAKMFAELGCTVLDADRIVAQLYAPGAEGTEAVRQLFGDEVLDASGAVDRPRLAERVFGDTEARKRLEAAIHPLVQQHSAARMAEAAARGEIVVYEATLLVEAGRADDVHLVVTVEAPEAVRLKRAIARGMDAASARARLEAQGDGALRRSRADRVIDSSGSLDDVRRQVEALVAELRQEKE